LFNATDSTAAAMRAEAGRSHDLPAWQATFRAYPVDADTHQG